MPSTTDRVSCASFLAVLPAQRWYVFESSRTQSTSRYRDQRRRSKDERSLLRLIQCTLKSFRYSSCPPIYRIPPNRLENTVGFVMERKREDDEIDCLRYDPTNPRSITAEMPFYSRFYQEQSTNRLFERWFHTTDLGIQLVPVIKESVSIDRRGIPADE